MGKFTGSRLNLSEFFNRLTGNGVNKKDACGETRLYRAARQGNVHEIKRLLRAGADPNLANHDGLTPLHMAAYWGETEIVALLIKAQADVRADNGRGWTPLHSAAISGGLRTRREIVGLLLEAGACEEIKDKQGWAPKDYMALWEQNAEAAEKLKAYLGLNTPVPENGRKHPRGPKLN